MKCEIIILLHTDRSIAAGHYREESTCLTITTKIRWRSGLKIGRFLSVGLMTRTKMICGSTLKCLVLWTLSTLRGNLTARLDVLDSSRMRAMTPLRIVSIMIASMNYLMVAWWKQKLVNCLIQFTNITPSTTGCRKPKNSGVAIQLNTRLPLKIPLPLNTCLSLQARHPLHIRFQLQAL